MVDLQEAEDFSSRPASPPPPFIEMTIYKKTIPSFKTKHGCLLYKSHKFLILP